MSIIEPRWHQDECPAMVTKAFGSNHHQSENLFLCVCSVGTTLLSRTIFSLYQNPLFPFRLGYEELVLAVEKRYLSNEAK